MKTESGLANSRRGLLHCACLGLASLVLAVSAWADIATVVNQVSETAYRHYMEDELYTHTGDNRGINGAEHDPAQNNIYNHFAGLGLTTTREAFTYLANTYYNVIGVMPGTTRASEIYILGAHYDSVNNPGADDNASGVAGVMEAARVLSQYNFEATIVFAAFDREEQGLYGSTAYATAHQTDHILGMISLDMIAYNPGNANGAHLFGTTGSTDLMNSLGSALVQYGSVSYSIMGPSYNSDHWPFEARGFQAALLIEQSHSTNPHYHRLTDSIDTLDYIDYAFATRMTKGAVGWVAGNATLVPEPAGAAWVSVLLISIVVWRRRVAHR